MVQQATRPSIVPGQWYPMSWDEFLEWVPEGKTEWVDGEGITYLPTTRRHANLVLFWAKLLSSFVGVFDLGEIYVEEFVMRLHTLRAGRAPDVMVILAANHDRVKERWYEGPADFVTEFVSEDDPDRDRVVKRREYEREGVPEYLWVDARPGHLDFRFHRRGDDGLYDLVESDSDGRYHSTVLPGFWFDPRWFWQEPLPDVERLMLKIAPQAYRRHLSNLLLEGTDDDSGPNV